VALVVFIPFLDMCRAISYVIIPLFFYRYLFKNTPERDVVICTHGFASTFVE